MTAQQKNKIILYIVFGSYIAFAVLEIVVSHTFRMLSILGVLGLMVVLSYPLGKWARDFRKLMESLPADHKYLTQHVAAIDINNIRFVYNVYEKGNGSNPFSKSYISMAVGIPFPTGKDDLVIEDLEQLLEDLQKEGSLTSFNPIQIVENEENNIRTTWLGRYFLLEYPQKAMTSSRLISLQERILDLFNKYHLQDYSWCIMKGRNFGTEYSYYQGNLLQSTVLVKDSFDRTRSDYKQSAQLCINEFESLFDVGRYHDLYLSASKNLGKEDLNKADVIKRTKQMFKGTRKSAAKISDSDNTTAVTITIPKQMAASTYSLTYTGDMWWIHAQGRLENIDPISVDNESAACDLFLRILSRYTALE